MDDDDLRKVEVGQGRPDRARDLGRRGPLELDTDPPVPAGDRQVELSAGVGRPEVDTLVREAQPIDDRFQQEPFPGRPGPGMRVQRLQAANPRKDATMKSRQSPPRFHGCSIEALVSAGGSAARWFDGPTARERREAGPPVAAPPTGRLLGRRRATPPGRRSMTMLPWSSREALRTRQPPPCPSCSTSACRWRSSASCRRSSPGAPRPSHTSVGSW